MVKTLCMLGEAGGGNTSTANTTQYWYFGAGTGGAVRTVETQAQILHRSAGQFNNLSITIITNTVNAATTFTFRKNGAAGNLTTSVNASTTGNFTDTTKIDSIVSGDKICLESKPGAGSTGTFTSTGMSASFRAVTDTVTRLNLGDSTSVTSASTTYFNMLGGFPTFLGLTTVEANAKCRQRKAGTFKNVCLNITTNARTASTYTLRKNGANGNNTISITATTTGFFEDTSHSDTVVAGDDICHQMVTGTGTASMVVENWSVDFISTAGFGQVVNTAADGKAVTDATTGFFVISGDSGQGTITTERALKTMESYQLSELGIVVSTNDVSSASTLTLRSNAANTALTASVTANTTGYFGDPTHTVNVAPSDTLSISLAVPSVTGTHNVTLRSTSFWTFVPSVAHTVWVEWEES